MVCGNIYSQFIFGSLVSIALCYQYHQGLMAVTWTLTVAAFIIIFIDVDGWVSESVSEMPHPLIGTITTGNLSVD